MNTQKIGRTKRAKLIRRAIAAGYTRYIEIYVTPEQERTWEPNGRIGGREIHCIAQSDTHESRYGYPSRQGELLVGPCERAGDPFAAELDANIGPDWGHDQYAQCTIRQL